MRSCPVTLVVLTALTVPPAAADPTSGRITPAGAPVGAPGGLSVADIVHFANLLDHEIFVFNEHYAKAVPTPERLDAIGGPQRYAEWRKAVLIMGLGSEDK